MNNSSTGTLTITGNCIGGSGATAYGANNAQSGLLLITGICIGGINASGANNASIGTLRATIAQGNAFGVGSTGLTSAVGVSASQSGVAYVERLVFGSRGQSPTSGPILLTDLTTNSVQFAREGGGIKTLVDAAGVVGILPDVSNVRSGVVYSGGNLIGTCAVPPAESVALGVPVDATTGTAAITAASIRAAVGLASANLDTQLDALPTGAEAAAAVRSELTTELNRIDATVSSRLATSSYTTPPSVGDIAAAVWGAATRTLTTAIDNSATIAAAVWSYATGRTITGGTVDTLTNAPSVPSEAAIASQVRAELATELGRIDVATSTRLATASYSPAPSAATTAAAVRNELATEMGRLDAAVSTRLAPAGTLARVTLVDTTTTLSNAPDVPTPEEIAAEVWSTTEREITGGTVDNVVNATPIDAGEIAEALRTGLQPELARLSNAATTQEVGDIVEGAMQP